MAELAERGIVCYDHLPGVNAFKQRFATGERPLAELRIVKPTLRYLTTRTGNVAIRATAKAARVIKRSLAGRPGETAVRLPAEPGDPKVRDFGRRFTRGLERRWQITSRDPGEAP